jgi:hypothetical protein
MMLRESSKAFGYNVDLRAVTDTSIDPGIPHGSLLVAFSDAVLGRQDVDPLRSELVEAIGDEGLLGAAGVIGNFSMMNRIADATGMPVGKGFLAATEDVRKLLGLDRFMHE